MIETAGGRDILRNKNGVKEAVNQEAKEHLIQDIREKDSLKSLPWPTRWFKLQSHITDENWSKWICRTRAGNTGLGNRGPNRNGDILKQCPLCRKEGRTKKTSESHVLLNCLGTKRDRELTHIE